MNRLLAILVLLAFSTPTLADGPLVFFQTSGRRGSRRAGVGVSGASRNTLGTGAGVPFILSSGDDWTAQDTNGNSISMTSDGLSFSDFSGNSITSNSSGFSFEDVNGNTFEMSPTGIVFLSDAGFFQFWGIPSYLDDYMDCADISLPPDEGDGTSSGLCLDGGVLSVVHDSGSPISLEGGGAPGGSVSSDFALTGQNDAATVTVASIDTGAPDAVTPQGVLYVEAKVVAASQGAVLSNSGVYILRARVSHTTSAGAAPTIESSSDDNQDHDGVGGDDCAFTAVAGALNLSCIGYTSYTGYMSYMYAPGGEE